MYQNNLTNTCSSQGMFMGSAQTSCLAWDLRTLFEWDFKGYWWKEIQVVFILNSSHVRRIHKNPCGHWLFPSTRNVCPDCPALLPHTYAQELALSRSTRQNYCACVSQSDSCQTDGPYSKSLHRHRPMHFFLQISVKILLPSNKILVPL